ncbi:transporter substrate-binding domain-containing protein [Silvanigrella paludirubra]|uniref:Transporter substrate-binding domain-containing protein n=1 Tax=Silvanigrella paludirubra TaxID=2499159 RepID=A0A6N6VXB7_9BACT|nr:transporter substrate-binding domain-containing protein [Silvanigrella paludirubra]KAB8040649.1 transporter substrate-binding domain-containing protein [Silvanigrella paludirubra]
MIVIYIKNNLIYKFIKFFILLLFQFIFIFKVFAIKNTYEIELDNNPPYSILDSSSKQKGIFYEIINAAFKAANIKFKFSLKENLIHRTKEEINSQFVIYYLFRTPEREYKYHWIHPLIEEQTCVFNMRTSKEITSINNLKNLRIIGTLAGGSGESILRSFGLENKMYFCPSEEICINRLKSHEIEAWIAPKVKALYFINKYHIQNELNHFFQIYESQIWLASTLNLSTKDEEELRIAIQKFIKTTQYSAIMKKYDMSSYQNNITH